ncbi:MAG TPA: hypothetical protein VJ927_08235 [Actinomycetota bacterium]|nr:hypothetical protein [Actinomycetota bacterium]
MATLAYVLLPVTGAVAYLFGDERARFHGLQAIGLGLLWPLALYACSAVSAVGTRVVFFAGVVVWLGAIAATALGGDPSIPGLRALLARLASGDPRARD